MEDSNQPHPAHSGEQTNSLSNKTSSATLTTKNPPFAHMVSTPNLSVTALTCAYLTTLHQQKMRVNPHPATNSWNDGTQWPKPESTQVASSPWSASASDRATYTHIAYPKSPTTMRTTNMTARILKTLKMFLLNLSKGRNITTLFIRRTIRNWTRAKNRAVLKLSLTRMGRFWTR